MENLSFDEKIEVLTELFFKACSDLDYRRECNFENFNQKLYEIYIFVKNYIELKKKYDDYDFSDTVLNERLDSFISEFPNNQKVIKKSLVY